jgi:hypothetical protein
VVCSALALRGRSRTGHQVAGSTALVRERPTRCRSMASNGEYVIRAASVKQYGVGFFDALNAGRFASGGHVDALKYLASHKKVAAYLEAVNARQAALSNPGASGLLQDLSILGNYTHAQNQIFGYNRANFAHATAANVPGLENAAKNAAAVAHAVGAYFNAHKAALFTAAHWECDATQGCRIAVQRARQFRAHHLDPTQPKKPHWPHSSAAGTRDLKPGL